MRCQARAVVAAAGDRLVGGGTRAPPRGSLSGESRPAVWRKEGGMSRPPWVKLPGGRAGLLDLVVPGADGGIYSTWWDEGQPWAPWFNVSGGRAALGSPVTAVARTPDHLDLFVTGTDGSIYSTWWHQGLPWAGWFNISGG